MKTIQRSVSFENKLLRLALVIGLLPSILLAIALYFSDISEPLKWLIVIFVFITVIFGAYNIRRHLVNQLRISTNIMDAMAFGDYSMRARNRVNVGALHDFNVSLNLFAETFAEQRLVTKEKQILLHKVIDQIDVAIVAVNEHDNIALMNPAAEKLFNCRFEEMNGWAVSALGLKDALQNDYSNVVEFEIKEHKKKVFLHIDKFFEKGVPQTLIFITDIQQLLRTEERLAWQRLLRVLSHEINNSLAPIASISDTLSKLLNKKGDAPDLKGDLLEGLAVIQERSQSLNNFIQSYQQLSKLPQPDKTLFDIQSLVSSIVPLFDNTSIELYGAFLMVYADESQLQQVLVNLLKNGQEAMGEMPNKRLTISWQQDRGMVDITVLDEGAGIANLDNLFIPFYTTKDNGSGIGLVLCRQIVANHGGELTLNNRLKHPGVKASILLPMT